MKTYLVLCIIWQYAVHGFYNPDIESQKIKGHNIERVDSSPPFDLYEPLDNFLKWNAVDGVKKTDISEEGCFHSKTGDMNPWWSVTFKNKFQIEGLVITNRQDCCGERLTKLTVTVDGTLCATYRLNFVDDPGATVKLKCASVLRGSTVKIARNDGNLTLCEVEAMHP